jgi:TonB family protein
MPLISAPFKSLLPTRRPRYAALIGVASIHLAALWLLATRMQFRTQSLQSTEIQLDFVTPNLASRGIPPPPTDWDFEAPENVVVPEPQINITPDQEAGEGIVATGIMQKLAPRLDPAHINKRPELPARLGSFVTALNLELRILVLTDGSVGDARIVRSSGEREIDQIAIETVKDSWHYLPASDNGKPIEAWTTVIVRFTPV